MPELSKDVLALLTFLLPGFLVAWVFYALTSHPKPSQFERVVQALIFTLVVRAIVLGLRVPLESLGKWKSLAPWDADAELLASLLVALAAGLTAAYASNNDTWYRLLREAGISRRSAHPSEWCGVLAKYPRYVVIHFKDQRRLYGWPEVWPSDPAKGHFFVVLASWLHENGITELEGTEGILVSVQDVKWVEFVKEPEQ